MQTHGNEHQSIAYTLASISQDLGHTAVALETSIAVFNADAGLSESSVVLFLRWGQFVSGFSLLFALAFDRCDHCCIAQFEPLKSAVGTDGNGGRTAESSPNSLSSGNSSMISSKERPFARLGRTWLRSKAVSKTGSESQPTCTPCSLPFQRTSLAR